MYMHAYTYIYMYICMYNIPMHIYIYMCMGNGISPPAFRDISKFHELRQFRVKGLGYMSSGLKV